jgi:hypothetical protein
MTSPFIWHSPMAGAAEYFIASRPFAQTESPPFRKFLVNCIFQIWVAGSKQKATPDAVLRILRKNAAAIDIAKSHVLKYLQFSLLYWIFRLMYLKWSSRIDVISSETWFKRLCMIGSFRAQFFSY